MTSTKINSVKMVRQIRDQQYEQIKNMSSSEKQAYFNEQAKAFLAKLAKEIDQHRVTITMS